MSSNPVVREAQSLENNHAGAKQNAAAKLSRFFRATSETPGTGLQSRSGMRTNPSRA